MHGFLLIVDDDPSIRELLRHALEEEGHHVHVASDGLHAIEQLRHGLPKLILLDLEMPRMNGAAFAAHLLEAGVRSSVRVVVISAAPDGLLTARALGADRYFEKPFDLSDVLDEVTRLLQPC